MKKNLKKALGILTISAIIPISAWAVEAQAADKTKDFPQWAVDACVGKNAGDNVTIVTPRGKTVSAVCQERDGKLIAKPDRTGKDFHRGGKGRGKGMRRGPEKMRFGDNNLAESLNLTAEQKTEIKAIMKDEFQKNEKLFEQLKSSSESFREAAMKSPFDEAEVRKIATEREQLNTELAVSRALAINKAMSVLTPEQKEKVAKIGFFGRGMGHGFGWEPGHGHGKNHGHGWGKNHGRGKDHRRGMDRKWKGPHGRGPSLDNTNK
ncbi:MAG: Spy/CpxP family protein refolding chaperone [Syntrophorhabdaceae bacterium]|nr:Spy/CpxP family protein refolding chaperone [Syntrophorhabdaceae bacterium]